MSGLSSAVCWCYVSRMIGLLIFLGLFLVASILLAQEEWGWFFISFVLSVAAFTWICPIFWSGKIQFNEIFNQYNNYKGFLLIGGYLLIGFVWSFFKWFTFLLEYKREYLKEFNFYCAGGDKNDPELIKRFKNRYPYNKWFDYHGCTISELPTADSNLHRICFWVMFWPYSLAGYCLTEVTIRFAKFSLRLLDGIYSKIKESVLKDIK